MYTYYHQFRGKTRVVPSFRWKCFRESLVARGLANYFPVKVVKTADLDPGRNYLLGSHPHGFICFGVLSAFGSTVHNTDELFPGIFFRLLSLREFYLAPGLREFALGAGKSRVNM